MRRILFLLIAVLCFCVPGLAQMQTPVTFSVTNEETPDGKLLVRFSGQVNAGWHVYGTDIPEGGPTPATLTVEKIKGLKADGALRATGKVKRAEDAMFGVTVSYMEGTASFEQAFTITDAQYSVEGYLTYGACSESNCMPPSTVEFSFAGKASSKGVTASTDALEAKAGEPDTAAADTIAQQVAAGNAAVGAADLWAPVTEELHQTESMGPLADKSLIAIFLLGMLGGLVALLTPCVWPIIPMTVSFFLKRSDDRRKAIRSAMIYGASIVVIYVTLGLAVTLIFGASSLNALSTNAVFNLIFCAMLVAFAASFFGAFDITLPSSWSNKINSASSSTTGMVSIFFMAFTLTLVSFSCTGPIIGFLLVAVSTQGEIVAPAVGMLGFALALAIPFTLFALFPSLLKSAPKSGGWMNVVKVTLGFVELAFALKFLSVADLAYGWHILDRETFLALWIALFSLLGLYLLGMFHFPHDDEGRRTNVPQFFLALFSLAFAMYMVPGLWGAPLKAISAFAPPISTQDFNLHKGSVHARFTSYEAGMAAARLEGKPALIDFTGFGCVNCRKMEAAVWTDPTVATLLNEKFVLISLYVDDKTPLAQPITVTENGQQRTLKTVGDKWSYLQRHKFGANTQPFYVPVNAKGMPLAGSRSYDEDVNGYVKYLEGALEKGKN